MWLSDDVQINKLFFITNCSYQWKLFQNVFSVNFLSMKNLKSFQFIFCYYYLYYTHFYALLEFNFEQNYLIQDIKRYNLAILYHL